MYGEIQQNLSFLNPNSFNRYIYVANNPVRFRDPLGLIAEMASPGAMKSMPGMGEIPGMGIQTGLQKLGEKARPDIKPDTRKREKQGSFRLLYHYTWRKHLGGILDTRYGSNLLLTK